MQLIKGGIYMAPTFLGREHIVRVRYLGVSRADIRGRTGPFAQVDVWHDRGQKWGRGYRCWRDCGHWDDYVECPPDRVPQHVTGDPWREHAEMVAGVR